MQMHATCTCVGRHAWWLVGFKAEMWQEWCKLEGESEVMYLWDRENINVLPLSCFASFFSDASYCMHWLEWEIISLVPRPSCVRCLQYEIQIISYCKWRTCEGLGTRLRDDMVVTLCSSQAWCHANGSADAAKQPWDVWNHEAAGSSNHDEPFTATGAATHSTTRLSASRQSTARLSATYFSTIRLTTAATRWSRWFWRKSRRRNWRVVLPAQSHTCTQNFCLLACFFTTFQKITA